MIRHANDTDELREAFYKVFKSRDPFTVAGREEFPVRVVLYPTDIYRLEAEQFEALRGAIHDSGERKFFISMVEAEPEPRNWDNSEFAHWVCEGVTFEEYMNIDLFIENAIYSSTGLWGLLLSHECHGLLICQPAFWNAFQSRYPDWRQDLEQFTQTWRTHERDGGINVEWLQPLLDYLQPKPYSTDKA